MNSPLHVPSSRQRELIAIGPRGADSKPVETLRAFAVEKGIEFKIWVIDGDSSDHFFRALSEIKHSADDEGSLIVNVSVGRLRYSFILLCAAMAFGVTTLGVFDKESDFLPDKLLVVTRSMNRIE